MIGILVYVDNWIIIIVRRKLLLLNLCMFIVPVQDITVYVF